MTAGGTNLQRGMSRRMTPEPRVVSSAATPVSRALAAAAIFVGALVYLTLCMDRSVAMFDEGEILFNSVQVMNGQVPHRDFFTMYPPGQYYILAALYKLLGPSILIERVWDTVVRACCTVLVFLVVGQAASRRFALVTAAVSLVFLGYVGTYGYPVFPALAAALASLALLTPGLERPNPVPWLFAAGVCVGAAVLFRYDVGVALFGAEGALVGLHAWFRRPGGVPTALGWLVIFGGGFTLVVLPVVVVFAIQGAIPDTLLDVVTLPSRLYVKARYLPFPRIWMLRHHPESFAVYLPVIVCAAAMPLMVAIARRWRVNAVAQGSGGCLPAARDNLAFLSFGLLALTIVGFAKGWVHVSANHMAMAIVASIALGGVVARPTWERGRAGRMVVGAALVPVGVLALVWLYTGLAEAARNVGWAADPATWELSASGVPPEAGTCRMPAGLERLACFRIDPAAVEAARYIQQRTSVDEPVFVGLSRHDKIFISDILFYFAVNRPSVTKWYEYDSGLQTSEPIQRAMIRELEQKQPRLIVIEDIWADWREPNESAISSGVTLLDDYLRDGFEPVATFGVNTVLRPRIPGRP